MQARWSRGGAGGPGDPSHGPASRTSLTTTPALPPAGPARTPVPLSPKPSLPVVRTADQGSAPCGALGWPLHVPGSKTPLDRRENRGWGLNKLAQRPNWKRKQLTLQLSRSLSPSGRGEPRPPLLQPQAAASPAQGPRPCRRSPRDLPADHQQVVEEEEVNLLEELLGAQGSGRLGARHLLQLALLQQPAGVGDDGHRLGGRGEGRR